MNSYVLSCAVCGAWAAAVAFGDCRARRVPNALVAIGLCAALAASLLHAGPLRMGFAQALAAGAVGFCALMPFYVLGLMGAGDVKVFAVLGAWCGLHALLALWIVATVAACVHALATLVALHLRGIAARSQEVRIVAGGVRRGSPFAAFLTLPVLAWLAWQFLTGSIR
jgi:prepilin peptidase CpaA